MYVSKGSKEALTVLIVTHVTHVKRVKRLHYVHNIDTLMLCQKGWKIMLCAQYRYIQCYVKRVKRLCYLHNMDLSIQMIKAMHVCVEGVERSFNSFNCYSCYSCWKGWKITLYTQYRYIQCYVERVERLCYVETRDIHIFAHNFLNIQPIFNPKKVLESWDLDLFNHTLLTCFDIHKIWW